MVPLLVRSFVPVRRKRIPARFYRMESGSEPVREWLKSLDKQERFLIGTDIKTVEFGWPIGMPVCRPTGRGLYEVRTYLPRNRVAAFCSASAKVRWFCWTGLSRNRKRLRSKIWIWRSSASARWSENNETAQTHRLFA